MQDMREDLSNQEVSRTSHYSFPLSKAAICRARACSKSWNIMVHDSSIKYLNAFTLSFKQRPHQVLILRAKEICFLPSVQMPSHTLTNAHTSQTPVSSSLALSPPGHSLWDWPEELAFVSLGALPEASYGWIMKLLYLPLLSPASPHAYMILPPKPPSVTRAFFPLPLPPAIGQLTQYGRRGLHTEE